MSIPKMMKAAVVDKFREPLSIREVSVPTPLLGEVLVEIVASGVCHTDLHAVDGDLKGSNEPNGRKKFNLSPDLRVWLPQFSLLTPVSEQYFGSWNLVSTRFRFNLRPVGNRSAFLKDAGRSMGLTSESCDGLAR